MLLKLPKKEEEKNLTARNVIFQGTDQSQLSRHVTRKVSVEENLAFKIVVKDLVRSGS